MRTAMVKPLSLPFSNYREGGMFIVLYSTVPVFLSLAPQNQLCTLDINLFGQRGYLLLKNGVKAYV